MLLRKCIHNRFEEEKKLQIFNFPRIILNCTMKSCFEFESTNRIAKKDTKITVHAKTYVKSNVGGALFFGGFFPELISA